MRWRFSLIDSFGNRTVIREPVGWDAFSLKVKRHPERHGTFRELQGNSFLLTGTAADLLRDEYELKGVRGDYKMKIEGRCGSAWEQVYLGKVGFDNYKFSCDTKCTVSVDLEQLGPLVTFINRFDQKVWLEDPKCFDQSTDLAVYDKLTQTITLPSKAILLRSRLKNSAPTKEYRISQDSGWFPISSTGQMDGSICVPFDNVEVNAIKDCKPQSVMDYYNKSNNNENVPEIIYNNPEQNLNCIGTEYEIDFRVKGRFKNLVGGTGTDTHGMRLLLKQGPVTFYGAAGVNTIHADFLVATGVNNVRTEEFDCSWTGIVSCPAGEKVWLDFFLQYVKFTNFAADVRLEIDPETYFNCQVVSLCDSSKGKIYLINETASRITESITNNALRVRSEFYGRPDSQPYSFAEYGCGSKKGLSMGMMIRKAQLADGSDPRLSLSMEDVFEALSAIDNIGIGNEGIDIRIEPWTFFYQSDVVFRCLHVDKLEKTLTPSEHWSLFKTGYDKWEAEDYNGLDEFLTKREFRTALTEVKNTLEKTCKWIASGYAWETTRRKQNDTKDWRYDNDTFIACLTNKQKITTTFSTALNSFAIPNGVDFFKTGHSYKVTGTVSNNATFTILGFLLSIAIVSGPVFNEANVDAFFEDITDEQYLIETGVIGGGGNILDPDTVYNFRISPVRNAMRWFNRVAQCYRNITNADGLIFTSGDGNFLAHGIFNDQDNCKLEDVGYDLSENNTITKNIFEDDANALPIMFSERVKFTFPMSFSEYNAMVAAPYGLIEYSCRSERGFAWIDEVEYNPEDGKAKFTLIPKISY